MHWPYQDVVILSFHSSRRKVLVSPTRCLGAWEISVQFKLCYCFRSQSDPGKDKAAVPLLDPLTTFDWPSIGLGLHSVTNETNLCTEDLKQHTAWAVQTSRCIIAEGGQFQECFYTGRWSRLIVHQCPSERGWLFCRWCVWYMPSAHLQQLPFSNLVNLCETRPVFAPQNEYL